jgi:SAM-dependent methyltransferase
MEGSTGSAVDVKQTVRQEWQGAAPLWRKWHQKLSAQSRGATQLVLRGAGLTAGLHVLDLASGTGEPALSVARTLGPAGRVVATDVVPEMLQAAKENASALGLTNMEFQVADADRLPFADREFDRVTCRFGLMFFPDIPKALAEHRRVLKSGGGLSYVVWGPAEENPVFSTILGPFLKHVKVPLPPPDAPGVFRFADEQKLAGVISSAGFCDVRTSKTKVEWPWPGPPQEAWLAVSELAAPFKKIIAALPPEKTNEVMQEVFDGIGRFYDGQAVNFPATLVAVTAVA